MKKALLIFIIVLSWNSFAQTLSFEEFLKTSKDILNYKALAEIKQLLPKEFYITAEDIGDFSGDGKNDFAIAVMPKYKRGKSIYTYLFCDSLNRYEIVFADTLKYFELPIEIGFSIANNVCFITQKLQDRNWEITGYSFYKNEFSLYDSYKTTVIPLSRKSEIGREEYLNYSSLVCFNGYFDLNSIEQHQKTRYFLFPVYGQRRNIYKNYKHKIIIDDSWMWNTSSNKNYEEYGDIQFSTNNNKLIISFRIDKYFLKKLERSENNSAEFYFDLSGEKLAGSKTGNMIKRDPKFRNAPDKYIGKVKIDFDLIKNEDRLTLEFADMFKYEQVKKIRLVSRDGNYNLIIPLDVFGKKDIDELNSFVQFNFHTNDGLFLQLKSSEGKAADPSTYGKLVLVDMNSHLGIIKNKKFGDLINIFGENGLAPQKVFQ